MNKACYWIKMKTSKGLESEIAQKYYIHGICFCISLASLALMLLYSGSRSLWADDIATISIIGSGQGLGQIFSNILNDSTPALFYVLAAVWIRVAPYGTFWLILPSVLFTALGMYVCGMVAMKIRGSRAAVFTTLFASASWWLIIVGAFGFRVYGLLFFITSMYIFLYAHREHSMTSYKDIIIFGVVGALLCHSHYFGIFIVASMFLFEVGLLIIRKRQWGHFISYIVCGILFVPYFIPALIIQFRRSDTLTFWASSPSIESLARLFYGLVSQSNFLAVMFVTGVVFSTILTVSAVVRKHINICWEKSLFCIAQVFIIFFTVGVVYAYSRYINPSGSVFVERFFIPVMPSLFFLSGIGADFTFDLLFYKLEKRMKQGIFLIYFCVTAIFFGGKAIMVINGWANGPGLGPWQPIQQVSYWIYSQEDAHESDTLIVMTGLMPGPGLSYYVTQNGRRPPLNQGMLTMENYYRWRTVYFFHAHGGTPQHQINILQNYFERIHTHSQWHVDVHVYRRLGSK